MNYRVYLWSLAHLSEGKKSGFHTVYLCSFRLFIRKNKKFGTVHNTVSGKLCMLATCNSRKSELTSHKLFWEVMFMNILEEFWYGNIEEGNVFQVCRLRQGISGYGRVSAVPEQLPPGWQNDAGSDEGRCR